MFGRFWRSGREPALRVDRSSARPRPPAYPFSLGLSAAALLAGCSFVEDFDSLREPRATQRSEVVEPTAGGGRIESPSYRLSLTVGPPQPMGVIESPSHRLELGPSSR
jgi:hypothetical protein